MDARRSREQLLEKLHGNAGIGTPVAGTNALACYQQLYALYFSDQEYLEAATVAYSLYSALDRSVRHSGEALPATSFAVVPVLEQQRAALLMLISALTLTPEQQLLMPGPTKPSFCAIESDDPAALQSWFQEAAECTRRAQVSLHEAQAMLLELDAKCNQEPLMEP
ncbi:unnamed protein product [Durusdinium trenchii]|uniref:Uncharacterized protein n=2 Tax=Durusdinium trenchii TaxID=1381693 RepID=A0ABP0PHC6_9DINO